MKNCLYILTGLALLFAFGKAVNAETTPFEAKSYQEVVELGWNLDYCKIWLGTNHNGECVWMSPEGWPNAQQATCFMWNLFSNKEQMSCQLQNLKPGYPVSPTVPSKVKEPFPGVRVLWNDALEREGFVHAYCGHEPRMQACYVRGDTWFTVCRLFQAAEKLKCRTIEVAQ